MESIRSTVYVNPDLWTLIQMENPKPNLSKIFNEALAAYLGLPYIHEPDLIREKTGKMKTRLRELYQEQQKLIEKELESEREDAAKKILREKIIGENLSKIFINPNSLKPKLPENDIHGDYDEWWQQKASELSKVSQLTVSPVELQAMIRRVRA